MSLWAILAAPLLARQQPHQTDARDHGQVKGDGSEAMGGTPPETFLNNALLENGQAGAERRVGVRRLGT